MGYFDEKPNNKPNKAIIDPFDARSIQVQHVEDDPTTEFFCTFVFDSQASIYRVS